MQLEPGEPFDITYGKGHALTVQALTARQKRQLVKTLTAIQSLDTTNFAALESLYDMAEAGVKVCCPGISDEQLAAMDEQQQMEIIGKTLGGAALSIDEQKKSELPHSSDAASCASHAEPSATT